MHKSIHKELPKTTAPITTGGSKPTGVPPPVCGQIKSSVGLGGNKPIPAPVSRSYKSHVGL